MIKGSIVDSLHMLDLIIGRAKAGDANFILAGPLNLRLQGVHIKVDSSRYRDFILVTTKENKDRLLNFLLIGASNVSLNVRHDNVKGIVFRGRIRGSNVELLVDPLLRSDDDNWLSVDVAKMARHSMILQVGKEFTWLAPLEFEYFLLKAYGLIREADRLLAITGFSKSLARDFIRYR